MLILLKETETKASNLKVKTNIFILKKKSKLTYKYYKLYKLKRMIAKIYYDLVHIMHFWNSFHQVHSKSKD